MSRSTTSSNNQQSQTIFWHFRPQTTIMATLKNLSALMTLLVVTAALLPRATFAGNPDCAKGMTSDCGSSFFQIIVLANTVAPTNECCRELVKAGKNCHDQFVELTLSAHKPIGGTVSDVRKRSNETWNNCVAAVSPPEPARWELFLFYSTLNL